MARYSVYRLKSGAMVLDCQADLLAGLPTRFSAPLLKSSDVPNPIARLHPSLKIVGERRIMVTNEAGAILVSEIAEEIASFADDDMAIANAFDMLLTGY